MTARRRELAFEASSSDPFANDVLERLIRSNQDYQREHGNYIVPLAVRLLRLRLVIVEHAEQWERDADDAEFAANSYDRRDEAAVDLFRQANRARARARELRSLLDEGSP